MKLLELLPKYGNLDKIKGRFKEWFIKTNPLVQLPSFLQGKLETQLGIFMQFFAENNLMINLDPYASTIILSVIDKTLLSEKDRLGYDALNMYIIKSEINLPKQRASADSITILGIHAICEGLKYLNLDNS